MVERLLPIHKITDLTLRANAVERELAMIKVMGKGTAIATNGRSAPRRRALCSSLPAAGQMRL
jgi:acetolactate synthase small subunit